MEQPSKRLPRSLKVLLSEINLKWIFNVERAPWWGGFFERMIQLLKRCLRKLISRAKLSYEELLISVSEVELILNSKPLIYFSHRFGGASYASHLYTGRRLLSLPDHLCYGNSEEDYHPDSSRVILNKRMKYLDTILKHFWSRWKREYLMELRENHRQFKGKKPDHVSVGDVVIIQDETPRGMWRLGIIEKELKGKDQETRGVVVRVKSGRGPSSFLQRPIQRLYPLEVRYQELTQPETNTIGDPGGSGSNPEIALVSSVTLMRLLTLNSLHHAHVVVQQLRRETRLSPGLWRTKLKSSMTLLLLYVCLSLILL